PSKDNQTTLFLVGKNYLTDGDRSDVQLDYPPTDQPCNLIDDLAREIVLIRNRALGGWQSTSELVICTSERDCQSILFRRSERRPICPLTRILRREPQGVAPKKLALTTRGTENKRLAA
ncbi:MAG: hypothetical protein ACI814_004368, partial [Mariniblastus sp.]